MKRIFYLLSLLALFSTPSYAQDDQTKGDGSKIRDLLLEYEQKKLELTKPESDRFTPVFQNYFNDLRKTNQDFKGDKLVLQQKVADLRLHYRDLFKDIIGEKRSNDVFTYERDFYKEVKKILDERSQKNTDDQSEKKDNHPFR